MAVVINEFEATGEPVNDAKGDGAPPREPRPHETRRRLRQVVIRAARVWAR
jgi:hypothetical protein